MITYLETGDFSVSFEFCEISNNTFLAEHLRRLLLSVAYLNFFLSLDTFSLVFFLFSHFLDFLDLLSMFQYLIATDLFAS